MTPSDQSLRTRVLDPGRSFIVQAPAGSGKTGLLIQRYLTLLSGVSEPEQVVAITFTRKAAAEMRGRILAALRAAADDAVTTEGHGAQTLRLARAALKRDTEQDWALLDQPHRLRIDTLDALNFWLAQQLPLLAAGIAGANVTDDAQMQYRQAARRTVDQLADPGALGAALGSLLALCENSLVRLEGLLASMLPTRDQWLRHIAGSDPSELRSMIDASLASLVADRIEWINRQLDDDDHQLLTLLMRHAAEHATPELAWLQCFLSSEQAKFFADDPFEAWRAVARLLLTKEGQWRKRFTKREGFGPTHKTEKAQRAKLMEKLSAVPGLRAALVELLGMPPPSLSADQAQILAALQRVLTHLLAELTVLFRQTQTVDFTELALAAQHALGAVDQPSNLLLALDKRIEHILVDEFQDTSQLQFRLLELLTAGWSDNDGRSLFLVGDPMQSIYRFRDADMTLFQRAQYAGVGTIACESVILEDNFRSAPALVDWVNSRFGELFGPSQTLKRGAARYNGCKAVRAAMARQFVELHAVDALEEGEHRQVIQILEQELRENPNQSIGILVQSRAHLAGLRAQLRTKAWPVHAIEIDSIADDQLGQDLLGLTRAMLHLGDRVAWLALLRAPWCGITWKDLEALCTNHEATVWQLIHDPAVLMQLSDDGQAKMTWLVDRLELAFEVRGAHPLSRWLECCWQLLDGPACLSNTHEVAQADLFFRTVDSLAVRGDIDDPVQLESAFSRPMGEGDPPREAGIEIMTIHRAKGLEFDTVILFGLGKEVGEPDAKALHWHEWIDSSGAERLIMAPLAERDDPLQRYLKRVERDLDWAERARLLYVATTRARERLHLITSINLERSAPKPGSLVNWLWPALGEQFIAAAQDRPVMGVATVDKNPPLRRLKAAENVPLSPLLAVASSDRVVDQRPEFEWVGPTAVHVGTLVHRELQGMAERRTQTEEVARLDACQLHFRQTLALLGVPGDELDAAVSRVQDALRRVLSDPVGQWILDSHREARSELRLTVFDGSQLRHLQVDRTFIDDAGTRWIIDYKVSQHGGGDPESFLSAEVDRYYEQMQVYANAMSKIDPRPIRVGLYFPLLIALREWEPDIAA